MNRRAEIPVESSDALGKLFMKCNEAQRRELVEMLDHYTGEFKKAEHEVDPETGQPVNSESLAYSVHSGLDEYMAEFMGRDANANRVTCRKGCSSCCHLHVTIDRHEAVLLLRHAMEQGLDLDFEHLERQRGMNLPRWRHMPQVDRACVFLGRQGDCRVYEHRPNACRKYQVVTPPEQCDTHKHPGHRVLMLVCPEAEVIASAALLAFPGTGSLPDMLRAAMDTWPKAAPGPTSRAAP